MERISDPRQLPFSVLKTCLWREAFWRPLSAWKTRFPPRQLTPDFGSVVGAENSLKDTAVVGAGNVEIVSADNVSVCGFGNTPESRMVEPNFRCQF